jgi:chorismate mutase
MSDELERYRAGLDALDAELIDVLARRAQLVDEVWAWKRGRGLPLRDPAREAAMRERLLVAGEGAGLSRAALGRVLDAVVGVKLSGR